MVNASQELWNALDSAIDLYDRGRRTPARDRILSVLEDSLVIKKVAEDQGWDIAKLIEFVGHCTKAARYAGKGNALFKVMAPSLGNMLNVGDPS